MSRYIVADGNPFDGFGYTGPFVSVGDATRYAEQNFRQDHWFVVPLCDPNTGITPVSPPKKMDKVFNRKEACVYLLDVHQVKRAPATLAKLAVVGGGPEFTKFGHVPRYTAAALDAWVLAITNPPDPVMSMQLDAEPFEFSIRSLNALRTEGIHTVGELVKRSPAELIRIPNLGKRSLQEIKNELQRVNLALQATA